MVINMVSLVMCDVKAMWCGKWIWTSCLHFLSFTLKLDTAGSTTVLDLSTKLHGSHSRRFYHWRLTKHIDTLMLQYYQSGKRLHFPNGCPPDIYRLILECWDMDPYRRKKPQAIMRDVNQILYQGILTLLFQRVAILIQFLLITLWGYGAWNFEV